VVLAVSPVRVIDGVSVDGLAVEPYTVPPALLVISTREMTLWVLVARVTVIEEIASVLAEVVSVKVLEDVAEADG
jgi:hypothetical protein